MWLLKIDVRLIVRLDMPTAAHRHRRTGIEILGVRHESAWLALKARKPLERSGGMLPRNIFEKQSLFKAFSCVLGRVFMHRASDEWKENIRNIDEQNLNREIARLLSENCPTN